MSDLTTALCYGLGTGVISAACLEKLGVDPVAFGAGMIGAIILQTVLRREDDPPRRVWPTLLLMLGSALFAAIAAPLVSPLLVAEGSRQAAAVHTAVAAAAGLLAQPVLVILQRIVIERIGPLLERWLSGGGKNV